MNDLSLLSIVTALNKFLWGIPLLILMTGGGLYLSAKLRFPQIHIIKIMKRTLCTLFRKDTAQGSSLTQFQTFSTALAATVGTGSIVGVGECIKIGGAGSVFWLWVSAFIGMGLSYCENYLGVKYSNANKANKTNKACGAVAYLEHIGKTKLTALLFALFTVLASFGMGNMAQSGAAASAAKEGFGISQNLSAIIILLFAFFICAGKNFAAKLCEKLVPIMSALFIGGSLFVILSRPVLSANALANIVTSAFRPSALITGSSMGAVIFAAVEGLKRGAFSNEAGLGSTVAVHSSCNIKSPSAQGMWGMAEVFIDTAVICTLTALVILTSSADPSAGGDLAVRAYMLTLGGAGKIFTSLSLILFALATLAGWFFIGEKAWRYLCPKTSLPYRLLTLICACSGALWSMELIWGISDIFNGLMAVPNIIGVLILSKEIKKPKL